MQFRFLSYLLLRRFVKHTGYSPSIITPGRKCTAYTRYYLAVTNRDARSKQDASCGGTCNTHCAPNTTLGSLRIQQHQLRSECAAVNICIRQLSPLLLHLDHVIARAEALIQHGSSFVERAAWQPKGGRHQPWPCACHSEPEPVRHFASDHSLKLQQCFCCCESEFPPPCLTIALAWG